MRRAGGGPLWNGPPGKSLSLAFWQAGGNMATYPTLRGIGGVLSVLGNVQNQLQSVRKAQFVEDTLNLAFDFLLACGQPVRNLAVP
jgi:hypothetical protein